MARLANANAERVDSNSTTTPSGVRSFFMWLWQAGASNGGRFIMKQTSGSYEGGVFGLVSPDEIRVEYPNASAQFTDFRSNQNYTTYNSQWNSFYHHQDFNDLSQSPVVEINGSALTWATSTTQTGALRSSGTSTWKFLGDEISNTWNGYGAHMCWWDRQLTTAERAALHNGLYPMMLNPDIYVLGAEGQNDYTGNFSISGGTTSDPRMPPVYMPRRSIIVPFGVVNRSGSSAGSSTVSGTLEGLGLVDGSSDGASTLSATIQGLGNVDGTSDGTSTPSGTMSGLGFVDGTSDGTSTPSGTATGLGSVDGSSDGTSTLSATASGLGSVDGSSDGTSTVSATASGLGSLGGSISTNSAVSATIQALGDLAGTSTGAASVSALIEALGDLAGTSAGSSTVSGSLIGGTGDIVGSSAGSSTVSGTLGGIGALDGAVGGQTTTTAVLNALGLLDATAVGSSSASGTLTDGSGIGGDIIGASAGSSLVVGLLTAVGTLVGSSIGRSSVRGLLTDPTVFPPARKPAEGDPFNTRPRTRKPLKVLAQLKFLTDIEGGRAILPAGPVYHAMVRFNGETQPSKNMRCEFQSVPDVNGNVKAVVSLIADDVSPLVFKKGTRFELFEGTRSVARGSVIAPAPSVADDPYLVFGTAIIPRN